MRHRQVFIQTSGSSIVGDKAAGEASEPSTTRPIPVHPLPEKAPRVAINGEIIAAAKDGVRGVVLCPSLIYGPGRGVHRDSVQVPRLIALAKTSGVGRHVGRGENIWSNVHIDDVAELFLLALEKAPAGSFFYAENGEASMKSVAQAISRMLGLGGATEAWPLAEASAAWGRGERRVHLRLEQPGPCRGGKADARLDPARDGAAGGDRARLLSGGGGALDEGASQRGINGIPG